MESSSLPLNVCLVKKADLIINRLHMFFHGIALLALFYYRTTSIFQIIEIRDKPLLPYVLLFISEIVLTFLWLLHQAFRWKPVTRTVYPERLPEDGELPPIDVFICTTDPNKEPSVGVMNIVISAMALDYPPEKLAVYLSDDGGSSVTFCAIQEAWKFSKWWIPFCRKYDVKTRCPGAYFLAAESDTNQFISISEFVAEKNKIEKRYGEFKESLVKISASASSSVSRDHPPIVEVMNDANDNTVDSNHNDMPLLVYVAREKRPSHPHHFKAGALNILLRVSAVISNAPYFLVLDCDMYCNDPTSARQAMCFYLDSKISPKLGFVQFPQKFHNISEHDIYDGRLNYCWRRWFGLDGLRGPTISGCNFYMRREAIYGNEKIRKDVDLNQLKTSFGSSHEFIKSIYNMYKPRLSKDKNFFEALQKEIQFLASCSYDNHSEWGEEVGFRYFTVVEDSITSLVLHCQGWISVYIDPARPCFLGASTTNLSDYLIQQTRWSLGLMQMGLSKFSPLLYGPLRMSTLQSMCYAAIALESLYVIPLYTLALIPQICLLHAIPLYPNVSDPFFVVFAFLFFSSQLKHVQDIFSSGDSIWTAVYELRIWMMKSTTCYLYATIGAILDKIGLHEVDFSLTNKVVDDELARLYQKGIYDFRASPLLIVPLCSLYIINVASLIFGIARNFQIQNGKEMLIQTFIPLFGIILNYHLLEGMVLRNDKGGISLSVSLLSVGISTIFLCFGSLMVIY